jgi:hypothetical protein
MPSWNANSKCVHSVPTEFRNCSISSGVQ